jgi:hypothetical protein
VELVDRGNGLTGHDLGQGNPIGSRSSVPGLFRFAQHPVWPSLLDTDPRRRLVGYSHLTVIPHACMLE